MNHFSKRDRLIGIKRLTRLADYLETINPKNFDLSTWAEHNEIYDAEDELKPFKTVMREIQEGACGTTACACGHAAMIPEFRKAGLKLEFNEEDYRSVEDLAVDFIFRPPGSVNVYSGLDAAEMFFKLSDREAEYLFMPATYDENPTRKVVVKRIRQQIKRMEAETR